MIYPPLQTTFLTLLSFSVKGHLYRQFPFNLETVLFCGYTIIDLKEGGIQINIEIHRPNRIRNTLHRLHSRLEDLMFSIIQKLPDQLLTDSLMAWMDRYTTKRLNQLKHQSIKRTWDNMRLQSTVDELSNRQRR